MQMETNGSAVVRNGRLASVRTLVGSGFSGVTSSVALFLRTAFGRIAYEEPSPVWKEVLHVGFRCDYRRTLGQRGFLVNAWADDFLSMIDIMFVWRLETVRYVVIPVASLGFVEEPSYGTILSAAVARGYLPCLPVDGPELRLAYVDQKLGESLGIATEPLSYGRDDGIFMLERDFRGMALNVSYGTPYHTWSLTKRFVFRLSSGE